MLIGGCQKFDMQFMTTDILAWNVIAEMAGCKEAFS